VASLQQLFASGVVEFVMSWNRRIAESASFFEQMSAAGFRAHHYGECVYSFYRDVVPPHVVVAATTGAGSSADPQCVFRAACIPTATAAAVAVTAATTAMLPAPAAPRPLEAFTDAATIDTTEGAEEEEDAVMLAAMAAEEELAALSPEESARLEAEWAAEREAEQTKH
jgi:hypothetical protein